ncbi:MAG: DUF4199 domain-containing protein [Croceitalea sp.]|nr:DUF4199 domain-containing protein [Croceitalea sp.]
MKKFATEIKWGVIFSIVAILWMVLEKVLGWHDTHIDKHPIYTNLFAIPAIIMVVLALREKRDKDFGGKMTWVQGFVSGLIITVVIAILTPLGQYITHEFITPDYFQNAINYAVENNKMSVEDASKWFNFESYMIQSIFGAFIMGIMTSAIVALFVKKK